MSVCRSRKKNRHSITNHYLTDVYNKCRSPNRHEPTQNRHKTDIPRQSLIQQRFTSTADAPSPHWAAAARGGFRKAGGRGTPSAVIALRDPKTETTYYVESNGRRLVALTQEPAVLWSIDVLTETKIDAEEAPALRGTPVIRHLTLRDDTLYVTIARSHSVKVDIKTGKSEFIGND